MHSIYFSFSRSGSLNFCHTFPRISIVPTNNTRVRLGALDPIVFKILNQTDIEHGCQSPISVAKLSDDYIVTLTTFRSSFSALLFLAEDQRLKALAGGHCQILPQPLGLHLLQQLLVLQNGFIFLFDLTAYFLALSEAVFIKSRILRNA